MELFITIKVSKTFLQKGYIVYEYKCSVNLIKLQLNSKFKKFVYTYIMY